MNKQKDQWYRNFDMGLSVRAHSNFDWAYNTFVRRFINHAQNLGASVYSEKTYGFFEPAFLDEIQEKLDMLGQDNFESNTFEYGERTSSRYWATENSVVMVEFKPEENHLSISAHSNNKEWVVKTFKEFDPYLSRRRKDNEGKAFVLAYEGNELVTREVGVVGVPLMRENYAASLQQKIDNIVEDLCSPTPSGRLVILEGPPGSGKTFLVRSLIMECPAAMFVVIPPTLVARLGDPSLLPTLLRLKETDDDDGKMNSKPVVLIVEDADECLAERAGNNMATISSILNLTSGILGEVLDMRIIATTNEDKDNFDDALLREGRMSVHLKIAEVTPDEATNIYRRLIESEDAEYEGKPLLANIYAAARSKGFRPPKEDDPTLTNRIRNRKKRRIGF